MTEDRELVEDKEYVDAFIASCKEVVGFSMMASFGTPLSIMPPMLFIARVPDFDFDGIPGMLDEEPRASTNDWRWGVVNDDGELWATFELWWPGDIERRLKISLQRRARSFFPTLVEAAGTGGIIEFGITNESKGMPTENLMGIQIDTNDSLFREIVGWVGAQPPLEEDE